MKKNLLFLGLLCLYQLAFAASDNQQYNDKPFCGFNDVWFDANFDGGRLNHCGQTGSNQYTLAVSPESTPINSSPWYAFRVSATETRNIEVFLYYTEHGHRYPPKISSDGETWTLLDEEQYRVIHDGKAISMNLEVGDQALYVAGQPIIDNDYYQNWLKGFGEIDGVTVSTLGESLHGRSIQQLVSKGSSNEWVLIVGRQHPPELTGAFALLPFVETLMAPTRLAERFRSRYNLWIVPNLNPDGVAEGNWRYNMNGVDLNRDWGLYQQPEIALMGNALHVLFETGGQELLLGLDFHSTNKDVFYTQTDNPELNMPYFTRDWLQGIEEAVPDFNVLREATDNPGLPTFKTYMSARYKMPAITVELGDNTDRDLLAAMGQAAATEMMQLLLDR